MNEGDPKDGLGKVGLDRGFLPQLHPAHVTGMHSPRFVISGKDETNIPESRGYLGSLAGG